MRVKIQGFYNTEQCASARELGDEYVSPEVLDMLRYDDGYLVKGHVNPLDLDLFFRVLVEGSDPPLRATARFTLWAVLARYTPDRWASFGLRTKVL